MSFLSNIFGEQQPIQRKLLEFSDEIAKLSREIKDIQEQLDKLEIKALESRKIYKKKLQQAFGEDEQKGDLPSYNPMFLPER